MTATRTDLQAALRKACEDAAKDIIRDAQCSVNLTCPSENSLISRMLQYVPPLFEALVAAAYAACAEHHPQDELDKACKCSCGVVCESWAQWEAHIRSLTPADAARELERRELEKVIEGLKTARARTLPGCRTIVNLGHVPEAVRAGEWVQMDIEGEIAEVEQRLASLSKPAPERCPSQFLGAFCELPKGHLGNHRGDEGEWKDYFTERLSKPAPVERSNENG